MRRAPLLRWDCPTRSSSEGVEARCLSGRPPLPGSFQARGSEDVPSLDPNGPGEIRALQIRDLESGLLQAQSCFLSLILGGLPRPTLGILSLPEIPARVQGRVVVIMTELFRLRLVHGLFPFPSMVLLLAMGPSEDARGA